MDKDKIIDVVLKGFENMPEHKAIQDLSKWPTDVLVSLLDSTLEKNYPNSFKYISTILNMKNKSISEE